MYEFETTVDIEIYHKDFPGVHHAEPVKIKWNLEFEMRSWGVKDMLIWVPEQEILLQYEIDDENGDVVDKEKTLQLTNVDVAYNSFSSIITPDTLQISDEAITLEF